MQYGLIAEEVDEVFPAPAVREEDGSAYTIRYEMLPVLLLNEMKKQKQDITDLKEVVAVFMRKYNVL